MAIQLFYKSCQLPAFLTVIAFGKSFDEDEDEEQDVSYRPRKRAKSEP
jgi:hypothetical protein